MNLQSSELPGEPTLPVFFLDEFPLGKPVIRGVRGAGDLARQSGNQGRGLLL